MQNRVWQETSKSDRHTHTYNRGVHMHTLNSEHTTQASVAVSKLRQRSRLAKMKPEQKILESR